MSETGGDPAARRQVVDRMMAAEDALANYVEAAANGEQAIAREELQRQVIRFYVVLRKWSDEPIIEDKWEDHGLNQFGALLQQQTTTAASGSAKLGQSTQREQRSRVSELSGNDLAGVCEALLEIARDLDFGPSTPDHQPHDEWDKRDIIELLSIRGQPAADEIYEAFYDDLDEADQQEVATDGGVTVAGGTAATPDLPRNTQLDELSSKLDRYLFGTAGSQKRQQADLKITVAANAQTGIGKTSLAVFLAYLLDSSPTGFRVEDQATLSTDEYREAYDDEEVEKGSALIMDEAEQLDARRAMSDENVNASFTWQTRRIREITTILTLPTWGDLDKRMRDMTDIRIEILRRGLALVHERDRDRYEEGGIFWKPRHVIEWPDMEGCKGYDRLSEMKEEFLGDEDGRKMLDEEEAQERINDATEDLRQESRRLRAKTLYFEPDNGYETQQDVADELGVTRQRVSQLVNKTTKASKGS